MLPPGAAGRFPLDSVRAGGAEAADAARTRFTVEDENGLVYEPLVRRLEVEEAGALRAAVLVEGDLARPAGEPLLRFIAHLHFFAGSAAVRFVLTLRNPRRAEHPGGLWDLGDGGSVYPPRRFPHARAAAGRGAALDPLFAGSRRAPWAGGCPL